MFVKSKASVIDVVMVVGHLYKHLSGPDNVQLHMDIENDHVLISDSIGSTELTFTAQGSMVVITKYTDGKPSVMSAYYHLERQVPEIEDHIIKTFGLY